MPVSVRQSLRLSFWMGEKNPRNGWKVQIESVFMNTNICEQLIYCSGKKNINRHSLLHYVCNKETNVFSLPFVAIVNENLHSK